MTSRPCRLCDGTLTLTDPCPRCEGTGVEPTCARKKAETALLCWTDEDWEMELKGIRKMAEDP